MSKEKSFWEKLFGCCCSERDRDRAYTGERDDDKEKETGHKNQTELPPQDLDLEVEEPGAVFRDVVSLGDGQDEDGDYYHVKATGESQE